MRLKVLVIAMAVSQVALIHPIHAAADSCHSILFERFTVETATSRYRIEGSLEKGFTAFDKTSGTRLQNVKVYATTERFDKVKSFLLVDPVHGLKAFNEKGEALELPSSLRTLDPKQIAQILPIKGDFDNANLARQLLIETRSGESHLLYIGAKYPVADVYYRISGRQHDGFYIQRSGFAGYQDAFEMISLEKESGQTNYAIEHSKHNMELNKPKYRADDPDNSGRYRNDVGAVIGTGKQKRFVVAGQKGLFVFDPETRLTTPKFMAADSAVEISVNFHAAALVGSHLVVQTRNGSLRSFAVKDLLSNSTRIEFEVSTQENPGTDKLTYGENAQVYGARLFKTGENTFRQIMIATDHSYESRNESRESRDTLLSVDYKIDEAGNITRTMNHVP